MSKTTRQYLADVKRRLEISSNYALAKRLEISEQAIAQLTAGNHAMSVTTAAKVAEILELEPLQVIADAELERGSSPDLWKRIRAAAAIAGAVIAGAVLYRLVMNDGGAFDLTQVCDSLRANVEAFAFAFVMPAVNMHCVSFAFFGILIGLALVVKSVHVSQRTGPTLSAG